MIATLFENGNTQLNVTSVIKLFGLLFWYLNITIKFTFNTWNFRGFCLKNILSFDFSHMYNMKLKRITFLYYAMSVKVFLKEVTGISFLTNFLHHLHSSIGILSFDNILKFFGQVFFSNLEYLQVTKIYWNFIDVEIFERCIRR